MSNKKQIHFYLEKHSQDYLESIAKENWITKSKALEKIIEEHKELSNKKEEYIKENLSKIIAKEMFEEFKHYFEGSFKSIRYADINTQIIIELLNYMILNKDEKEDILYTTKDVKMPILDIAEEKVKNEFKLNTYKKKGSLF